MSLNGIAASAMSALKTNSAALSVVSSNVSNMNTPGYARRVVNLQTLAPGGQLMGVDVASVQRVANQFLSQEVLSAGGAASQYDTMSDLFSQLNGLLGGPATIRAWPPALPISPPPSPSPRSPPPLRPAAPAC